MNEGTPRWHRIRSLEVQGGFLDGLHIELDPHLNCVIGGRGTGKTTVLEFLRYGLAAMPDAQRAKAQHRAIAKLVSGNLQTGLIRVGIETKDGLRYLVERSLNGEPEVLDEQERPTGLSLEHGAIFDLDVYSQNEIESIATSPSSQLALIDKFVDAEVRELERRLRAIARELHTNASEMLTLTAQRDELAEGLAELDVVNEKLQALRLPGQGEQAARVDAATRDKSLRERERRALEHARAALARRAAAFARSERELERELRGLIPDELTRAANGETLAALRAALARCADDVQGLLEQVRERLEAGARELEEAGAGLAEAHRLQEEDYRSLMAEHEQEQGRARERLSLQSRQAELLERRGELARAREAVHRLQGVRRELMRELSELRDRRTTLRQQVVDRLNRELAPQIRVGLTQAGDTTGYRELLAQAFKGSRRRYQALVSKVVETIPPQDLARLVQTEAVDELVELLDVSPDRARGLVDQLEDTLQLYAIEGVDMQDLPRIELLDGERYKAAPELSTGQRCTTILPIILLESEKPLLIDQPEDNLDNAFIYETVVARLRAVRGRRQLVFVTHNPNIPVLGDAGQIVVMSSTGRRATVEAAGGVDAVKEHVETILEGGREAFAARLERYGH